MRPSRSRRTHRNRRNRRGGGDEPKPSLFSFSAAQPNPNLPLNPLHPPLNPLPYVNPNPPHINANQPPPYIPQLMKSNKAFPHPVKLGGKRRTRRTHRR